MTEKKISTSFVISPFGEPYDTYFSHIIKPVLEECGLFAVRGDSLYRPTTIVDDIWQGIRDADLLIAELTERNPNVFYELGLAHAISKPVILISKSIDDVPFDLRSIRVLLYDKDHPEWGKMLRDALRLAVKEVQKHPTSAIPSTFKTPVKVNAPAEAETLIRLERLESLAHTFAERSSVQFADEKKPLSGPAKEFKVGQMVHHEKFGAGIILSTDETKHRASINFSDFGMKVLDTTVAKLLGI